jgi:hypothetical protein
MPTTVVQPYSSVSSVTLTAKSDLVQPNKYQWYRNNKMVGGSQWIAYTILNVSADDMKAKWSVVVTGENGTERSTDFTLSTAPPPAQAKGPFPASTVQAPQGQQKDYKAMGFTDAQIAAMRPVPQSGPAWPAGQANIPQGGQQRQAAQPQDLKSMGFTDAQIGGMKGK